MRLKWPIIDRKAIPYADGFFIRFWAEMRLLLFRCCILNVAAFV